MKQGLHPEYLATTISCACGAVYQTRSTVENMRVDICASCHPFFTGEKKLVDTGGRIERFNTRYNKKK